MDVYSQMVPNSAAAGIAIPRERPGTIPVSPVTGDPYLMPAIGPDPRDPRSRNRRTRRRPNAPRPPVTDFDELQEAEAARGRNDLAIAELREMSEKELRSIGRELDIELVPPTAAKS